MIHRRNSIIRKDQYQSGVRVGAVINVNGRFPQQGQHSDCAKNILLYVMKGSGVIALKDQRAAVSAGSVLHLKHCEMYHLKGQFSLYMIPVR